MLMVLIPNLIADEEIYRRSEISKWENIEKPLLKVSPKAKRIYELYDIKKNVAIKVYLDAKGARAFVAYWNGQIEKISCDINGVNKPADEVFVPLKVKVYEQYVEVGLDNVSRRIDYPDKVHDSAIGYWFKKPDEGLLRITLKGNSYEFQIKWSHNEESPHVEIQNAEQDGAGQPATAPKLKSSDDVTPNPESKPRTQ